MRRWLRSFARWILATVHPPADEVDVTVLQVFQDCGLNREDYQEDYDLQRVGKLHEVLIHSAHALGFDLRTVADVKSLLR
jgi:hypothetical protein